MGFKRLSIPIHSKSLTQLTSEAWHSIHINNDPPHVYRYGTSLARIIEGPTGEPMIEPLNFHTLRGIVDETAFWHKITPGKGNEEPKKTPVFPIQEVVHNMLASPDKNLPLLKGIVHVPGFAANGTLHCVPGYSPDTQQYYHPNFSQDLPEVVAKPDKPTVLAARDLILTDLIHDFPFESRQHDEGYVLCMLLQPFIRNLIDGFCPFFLIDKPQAGTGASLLAQSIITIVTGGRISAASSLDLSGGESEISKKLLATFMNSPQVVFLDNLIGDLDSKRLTETITSHYYADRVLGVSKIAHYPVRCLWIATGNNPKMSADMVRRCIRVRLNANMAKPESRSGFKHENLEIWVANNLPRLIHACLVIIQYWISKGRPLSPIKKGGGFEHWSQIMGGILDLLDLDAPFLVNTREMHSHLDDEGLSWQMLLEAWWAKYENKHISSQQVRDLIVDTESDVFVPHTNTEAGAIAATGRKLTALKDKMFGPFSIKLAPPVNNSKRWQLDKWESEN